MNSEKNSLNTFTQIRKKLLPVYEQAAELQGVNLKIVATEGESYQSNSMIRKVMNDSVAISLCRDETDGEIEDFFDTVLMIRRDLPEMRYFDK